MVIYIQNNNDLIEPNNKIFKAKNVGKSKIELPKKSFKLKKNKYAHPN